MNKKEFTTPLPQGVLEAISKTLGDTSDGLKGSEIKYFLEQSKITDVNPEFTKWKRIYNAFVEFQNANHCSNNILTFIKNVMQPSRYKDRNIFEEKRKSINETLSYVGYELQPNGRFKHVNPANTISEAKQRVDKLIESLKHRNAHMEIFKYCTVELLDNNYFHAVFEACKGLFDRIRNMSDNEKDSTKLVQEVFGGTPLLIINSYSNKQEKDEQKGFQSILEGICYMFRNPEAHQPKIEWPLDEQDALDIFSLISYCHRRLDKAKRYTEL